MFCFLGNNAERATMGLLPCAYSLLPCTRCMTIATVHALLQPPDQSAVWNPSDNRLSTNSCRGFKGRAPYGGVKQKRNLRVLSGVRIVAACLVTTTISAGMRRVQDHCYRAQLLPPPTNRRPGFRPTIASRPIAIEASSGHTDRQTHRRLSLGRIVGGR